MSEGSDKLAALAQTPLPVREYPTCSTCVFCDYRNLQQPLCRRSTPKLLVVQAMNQKGETDQNKWDSGLRKFWPVVDLFSDWCGEHLTYEQAEENRTAK